MYSLDIETVISVLRNRRITGFLEADLATGGLPGVLSKGLVRVELREGNFVSIIIRNVQGQILYQGQEALRRISRVVFTWQLIKTPKDSPFSSTEEPTIPSSRGLPAPVQNFPAPSRLPVPMNSSGLSRVEALVPVRYATISPEYLRRMSRIARSVHALVNGVNSVQRIAELLSLPVNVVYAELLTLHSEQLILFKALQMY